LRKVILKLSLLSIPVLAVYIFAFIVLYKSGEILSIREIIDRQITSARPVIYGSGYSERTVQYKYNYVLIRKPSIIAMGRSRVMQFRSAFFKDPASFFNAGGGIIGIEDIQAFLEGIPNDKTPRMIILSLDQHFFNPNWDGPGLAKFELKGDTGSFEILLNQGWYVFQGFLKHKYTLAPLFKKDLTGTDYIGINAIRFQKGYRKDGSYSYGKNIKQNSRDFLFTDTLDAIAKANDVFVYGNHISPKSVVIFEKLLKYCQQRDIHVVVFMPPYAHLIYNKLMSMPKKFGFLPEIEPKVAPICKKYGASFFNFSDINSVGATDLETTDGLHGSEKAYLRLFLLMQKSDPLLHDVAADETYLQKRLADAPGPYVVFGQDE